VRFDNPFPRIDGIGVGAAVCTGLLAAVLGLWTICAFVLFGLIFVRGSERHKRRVLPDAIVHLRSFGDDLANQAFDDRLLPVLCCFGSLYAVVAEHKIRLHSLARFINVLRRTPGRYGQLEPVDKEHWQLEVEELLRSVKLAVIDISTPSESVRWELSTALEILGPERLILVSSDGAEGLGEGFEEATRLSYRSPTLERDVAFVVQEIAGPPPLLKRQALLEYLLNGYSPVFYLWFSLFVLVATLREGISLSRIRGLRLQCP
jgi:hypothetical protein